MRTMKLLIFLLLGVSFTLAKDLYGMFDMTRSSFSKEALQKKMKKILLKYHPDKNKSPDAQEKLLEYREAFEILEDDKKRSIYDARGFEAAKNADQGGFGGNGGGGSGGFGGFDPNDLFEKFFGGGRGGPFGGSGSQGPRRTADAKVELKISLEDAYNGKVHTVHLPRTKICKKCKGVGAENPRDVSACSSCGGTGTKTYYRQFGPGMLQQFRSACDACGGKGKTFKSRCPNCHGNKVERVNEELKIKVEAGVADGHTIKYPKMADEEADKDPGDLYVVLNIEPHGRFRRDGPNLYTKLQISLDEALLGFEKRVKHLDGRMVTIKRSGVTQPNQVESISNEGMPGVGKGGRKGSLFIELQVYFPSTIPQSLRTALEKSKNRDEL